MNIFCCNKPLWAGDIWQYQAADRSLRSAERKIGAIVPVFLESFPLAALHNLKRLVDDTFCNLRLPAEQADDPAALTDAVLTVPLAAIPQLQALLRQGRWRPRQMAAQLETVLANIQAAQQSQPEMVLDAPGNMDSLTPSGDIGQDMAVLPVVAAGARTIGLRAVDFPYPQALQGYTLALQSKGYWVTVMVSDDDQYRWIKDMPVKYIMYV